jgi:hypothetical protein
LPRGRPVAGDDFPTTLGDADAVLAGDNSGEQGDDDDDEHPKLMGLKFMQMAEAADEKAKDELIQEIK